MGVTLLTVLGYIVAAVVLVPAHGLGGAVPTSWSGASRPPWRSSSSPAGATLRSSLTGRALLFTPAVAAVALGPEPSWPVAALLVWPSPACWRSSGPHATSASLLSRVRGALGR